MNNHYQPPRAPVENRGTLPPPSALRLAGAVAAGVVAQAAGAFILMVLLGMVLLATETDPSAFAGNPQYQLLDLLALFAFQVPAGYVAAAVAKGRPLVVSCLVAVVVAALALTLGVFSPQAANWYNVAALAVMLAAPVAGGLLWGLRNRTG
jgi:hypothetical protein